MRKIKEIESNSSPTLELSELIEFVNFYPTDKYIPDSNSLIRICFEDTAGFFPPENEKGILKENFSASDLDIYKKAEKEAIKEIKLITKNSKKLFRHIFENEKKFIYEESLNSIFEKYDAFLAIRQNFLNIVVQCEWFYKTGYFLKTKSINNPNNFRINDLFGVFLSVNQKGQITFHSDLINILTGIEAARLRRCLNCKSVIWAYRLNQKYCDKKCSNAFHQKKIRSNPKRRKEINERRRENYEYKQQRSK